MVEWSGIEGGAQVRKVEDQVNGVEWLGDMDRMRKKGG